MSESASYRFCACRDCFEIIIGPEGDVCDECGEAGCEPDMECKSEFAYGGHAYCYICGHIIASGEDRCPDCKPEVAA
jgi:RNA polymerase subunit RPABC4/transcription elongation factor Spt4